MVSFIVNDVNIENRMRERERHKKHIEHDGRENCIRMYNTVYNLYIHVIVNVVHILEIITISGQLIKWTFHMQNFQILLHNTVKCFKVNNRRAI